MKPKIELVNAIPELRPKYEALVLKFIQMKLITLDEWNKKFKNYRDDYGYSIIHYLESSINSIDIFLTINPIMLKNKKELEKRFGVRILSPEEAIKEIDKKKWQDN